MQDAVMTQSERDEILETLIANYHACKLGEAVEPLRGLDDEFGAKSLVSYADNFDAEVRQRVIELIRKHPERHHAIMSVLKIAIELVEAERAELKDRHDPEAARKLNDVGHFERYVHDIGRETLTQSMAQ